MSCGNTSRFSYVKIKRFLLLTTINKTLRLVSEVNKYESAKMGTASCILFLFCHTGD